MAWLTRSILGSLLLGSIAHALPAFPGAEGFGAVATGGRATNSKILKVTNLDASGAGSLQATLNQTKPRIIVFAVSGVITGDITVTHGDVTIAGQTAPGAGITIAGRLFAEYDTSVNNIIVRHVRVRPPPRPGNISGDQYDGIQFSLNSRVIFDHVSASWGVDETIDLYEGNDVTVQWSDITEGAVNAGHPDGAEHNYGLINGPDGHRISVHHNLFAHNKNRNPAIANGPADVRNNYVYNVRHGFIHHNPAEGDFNLIGNCYKRGPDDVLIPFFFDDEEPATGDTTYYLDNNFIDDPGEYVGVVDNPWQTPYLHASFADIGKPESDRSLTELDFSGTTGYVPITTQSAAVACPAVLAGVGAFPRDTVTTRIVDETENRTGSWDAHRPANLLLGLTAGTPPVDTDGDGIPDTWEATHGLDPNDAADANDTQPSGYMAIEEYINGLADELVGVTPPSPPDMATTGTPPDLAVSLDGSVVLTPDGSVAKDAAISPDGMTITPAAKDGCGGCNANGEAPNGVASLLILLLGLRRRPLTPTWPHGVSRE